MNHVPNYFIPLLDSNKTPSQFIDVIGFCLYKGLKLNFSANKNMGFYFGYFTYDDEEFVNCDSFKFFDLNQYLFKENTSFSRYILNNKVLVSLYYKTEIKRYVLKIKEEKYSYKRKDYKWVTKEKVVASSIKETFSKMNHRLNNKQHHNDNQNNKVLYFDRYKYG